MRWFGFAFIALVGLMFDLAQTASAQESVQGSGEFSLSIGYANVSIGDSSSALHSEGALKFDPVLSFSPIMVIPQLRLGLSLGTSLVLDNSQRTFVFNNGGTTITGSSDIPLVLFEPEARISWRQTFGKDENFFVEPGFGFGGAFGWLDIDTGASGTSATSTSLQESASAWEGRVFLYAGARVAGGTAGLEFSYMRGGNMDFSDNAHGDVNEYYIGIFGAIQF